MGLSESELIKRAVLKLKCEESHLFFTRYFFKKRQELSFRVNWHHEYLADTVDAVIRGEIQNLVINISPGASKTELVIINFIARGLALNPRARFLHLSGSDSLASLNSATARDLIQSEAFQEFWPLKVSNDTKSKKRWNIDINGLTAGGVYATAMGGQVTGFRAGHMAPGFQGAILIDDPVKPEDAFSKPKLLQANRKLITTVKSRKANPLTPLVLIMQRVAEHDPSGFVKSGALEGDFKFVTVPALIDDAYVHGLPARYQDLIDSEECDDKGRFSYWPYKEPLSTLLGLEAGGGTDADGNRISRHVFHSQYQQTPKAVGGNIIKGEYFKRYTSQTLPRLKWRKIFADTAQKTKQRNDFSVLAEYGLGVDGQLYILDLVRGRWEAPELERRTKAFWAKAKARNTDEFGGLRKLVVEDKSSGTGLIQYIKSINSIPVDGIERSTDKLTRAMDALPYLESNRVSIPEDASWVSDFLNEAESFTADDSHDFDDQLDTLFDAINDMLSTQNATKIWERLGQGR